MIFPKSDTNDEREIIDRIGDADAVLGSWNIMITENVLAHAPNLRYIGVCGTNTSNIDTQAAHKRGITVRNVTDYGDEATAEYIFTQLLNLARGFGPYQWKGEPTELHGKTIGIIGLGAVGQQMAKLALGFTMRVQYHSRTRRPDWEAKGLAWCTIPQLLQTSDIISLHVPKNLVVMPGKDFERIPHGTIFVDTCLGLVSDRDAFLKWVNRGKNLVIVDDNKKAMFPEGTAPKNVIGLGAGVAGITIESRERLSKKVLDNIVAYLNTPATE